MELGIDTEALLGPGEPGLFIEVLGPLAHADLQLFEAGPLAKYEPKRMTERHHALARAIASGMKDKEAAAVVGYVPQMVVILRGSPAFMDLVDMYRETATAEFAKLVEQFAGLTKDAMLALRERLEAEPENFSNKQLLEIVTAIGDRAGFTPVKRVEQLNVNVSLSEKLALARARMKDVTPRE